MAPPKVSLLVWKRSSAGFSSRKCRSRRGGGRSSPDTLAKLGFQNAKFRPQSLRYPFPKACVARTTPDPRLIQGRWQAAKTARIYINEGLAEMKMPWTHGNLTFKRFSQAQASGPLPELELAKRRSGGRGRRPQVPK